jgi:hypothetical protein
MVVNGVFHTEVLEYFLPTIVLFDRLLRVNGGKNHVALSRDNKGSHSTQKEIETVNVIAFLVNFLAQTEVLRL